MTKQSVSFIESLVTSFPKIASILDEHRRQFGEILSHVFFGDLTRHVLSLLRSAQVDGDLASGNEVRGILSFLENAYLIEGAEIQELIAVSFLENLPRPSEEGSQIRTMLGPTMSKQLELIG